MLAGAFCSHRIFPKDLKSQNGGSSAPHVLPFSRPFTPIFDPIADLV